MGNDHSRTVNVIDCRASCGFSSGDADETDGIGEPGCLNSFSIPKKFTDGTKRWVLLALLALLIGMGCKSGGVKGTEHSVVKSDAIFNGEDLSGFYTWLVDSRYADPRDVFSVTNGSIRISGDGLGYLATKRELFNYRFYVEYRWGERNTKWGGRIGRARDSGVFLHATGPDGNSHDGDGAFMAAIECNIFEGATGDFLLIRGDDVEGHLITPRVDVNVRDVRDTEDWPWWDPDGDISTIDTWGRVNWKHKDPEWRDEFGFRGRRDIETPIGQWNQLEIECRGHTISLWLNGQLINRATNVYPEEGKILLQCEGSEIFFRKLELTTLD